MFQNSIDSEDTRLSWKKDHVKLQLATSFREGQNRIELTWLPQKKPEGREYRSTDESLDAWHVV